MTTLGDLGADPDSFAAGPFGSAVSSKHFVDSGVPMIRGSNLSDDVGVRLDATEFVFLPRQIAEKFPRSIATPGDLVFTCWGTIGQIGIIDAGLSFDSFLVSNKQMKFTPDKHRVDSLFIYYYLSQPSMVNYVRGQAIGSSVPGFNLGQLKTVPVKLPTMSVQRSVAEVLGALDDKIAANRRALASADELLRQLYERLDTPVRRRLDDIADHHRQPVSLEAVQKSDNYVGLEHLDPRSVWLVRNGRGTEVGSAKNDFRAGDTLFGKLRPYFHKVAVADCAGVCSTDIIVLRPKQEAWQWLVASAAGSDAVVAQAVQNSNGTKMPRAKWADIAGCEVPDPDAPASRAFCDVAETLFRRGLGTVHENHSLATTRDELLPLLMNGRITVKDAERRVEREV